MPKNESVWDAWEMELLENAEASWPDRDQKSCSQEREGLDDLGSFRKPSRLSLSPTTEAVGRKQSL